MTQDAMSTPSNTTSTPPEAAPATGDDLHAQQLLADAVAGATPGDSAQAAAQPASQPAGGPAAAQQHSTQQPAQSTQPAQSAQVTQPAQDGGDGRGDGDRQQGEDRLGEAGKRALHTERQARRAAERELAELRKRLQAYEDREKTELQKAQEAAERYQAELRAARVANARLMAAAMHNIPPDLIDLLGDGTDEEIEARAKLLAERLAAAQQPAPTPAPAPAQRPEPTRPVESLTPGGQPVEDATAREDPDTWIRRLAGRL